MRIFFTMWLGQMVSITGSNMSGFALGIYAFPQTGSPTQFALISLANVLPRALLSPVAGVLADRLDRRRLMLLADLGSRPYVWGISKGKG
jgi:MFS family permease